MLAYTLDAEELYIIEFQGRYGNNGLWLGLSRCKQTARFGVWTLLAHRCPEKDPLWRRLRLAGIPHVWAVGMNWGMILIELVPGHELHTWA